MEAGRTRSSRPLVEFAATVTVVAALLAVSFFVDYTLFRVLLAVVTVLVAAMWVLARR